MGSHQHMLAVARKMPADVGGRIAPTKNDFRSGNEAPDHCSTGRSQRWYAPSIYVCYLSHRIASLRVVGYVYKWWSRGEGRGGVGSGSTRGINEVINAAWCMNPSDFCPSALLPRIHIGICGCTCLLGEEQRIKRCCSFISSSPTQRDRVFQLLS